MENTLKGLEDDDLRLAIWKTLFGSYFWYQYYLKHSALISFKKIDFLKLNFQLRPHGFFFERKGKSLGLLSSPKSPGDKGLVF